MTLHGIGIVNPEPQEAGGLTLPVAAYAHGDATPLTGSLNDPITSLDNLGSYQPATPFDDSATSLSGGCDLQPSLQNGLSALHAITGGECLSKPLETDITTATQMIVWEPATSSNEQFAKISDTGGVNSLRVARPFGTTQVEFVISGETDVTTATSFLSFNEFSVCFIIWKHNDSSIYLWQETSGVTSETGLALQLASGFTTATAFHLVLPSRNDSDFYETALWDDQELTLAQMNDIGNNYIEPKYSITWVDFT